MEISSDSEFSRYSEASEQRSIEASCQACQGKLQKQDSEDNYSEEIKQQNLCNKRNEKLNKPCENGFCYCFTSDSDQHVRKRKPKVKPRKYCCESSNNSEENTSQTSDISEEKNNTKNCGVILNDNAKAYKQYNHKNQITNRSYQLTAKTSLDCNKNSPLIHIIQEIYSEGIISEVKINKQKLVDRRSFPSKIKESTRKQTPKSYEHFTEETLREIICESENEQTSKNKISPNVESKTAMKQNEDYKVKSKSRKPGQLLKRRVSDNFPNNPRKCDSPPKKPPRRYSDTNKISSLREINPITNIKDAEVVLDKFLKKYGQSFAIEQSYYSRKSFPFENLRMQKERASLMKIAPSCPNLDELKSDCESIEPNIEWVSKEINAMLTYDETEKVKTNFQSLSSEPRPQMGWVIPPKQEIDMVDGHTKPTREFDNFNNLAKNMASKNTPVKSEFINNQSKSFEKSFVTPNNKSKTESTCEFFKNSAQKFVNLVSKISKDKMNNNRKNNTFFKNVSCQTTEINLNDTLDNANNKKPGFSLQSPPGSYFSNSPKKNNDIEEFDFNRHMIPPKHERFTQRRLSFSPKKIMHNFQNRNSTQKTSDFYQSYESEFKKDFSLNLMNDILRNIKAKLEASDIHASNVFHEVRQSEEARNTRNVMECTNRSFEKLPNKHKFGEVSAAIDIHDVQNNNPNDMYSEIEEEQIVFTGSPSIRSLNEISHFYANNDPNSEYAEVRKNSKYKLNNRHSYAFVNMTENPKDVCVPNHDEYNEPSYADIDKINDETCSYDSVNVTPTKISLQNSCECVTKLNPKLTEADISGKWNTTRNCAKLIEAESISKLSPTSIAENPVKELYKNKLNHNQNCVNNLTENEWHCAKVANGCVVIDELKPVRELVDYFETSFCHNNTCDADHNISHESSHQIPSAFKELTETKFNEEDEYDTISDISRRKSFPLTKVNLDRENSIGTYTSSDYKTNESLPKSKKYHFIKSQLRKSFRKGKSFFKIKNQNYLFKEKKSNTSNYDLWEQSSLGINNLFVENGNQPWEKQLEKAVFMCRKFPVLENSIEAVEAERLLLYSKLKHDTYKNDIYNGNILIDKPSTDDESWLNIEEFELPIQNDIQFSEFFNFFYVGVFCDGNKIISTNYAEKHDKLIIFRNCKIIFDNITPNKKIKCDIYVLRLRKILNTNLTKEQIKSKIEELNYLSDSNEQLLSRFKFQGSFQLFPQNFTPFKIDKHCERKFKNSNKFCLHSYKTVNLPIDINVEDTLLLNYVIVTAKLEIIFDKFTYEGFLNVRSISSEHDWNKRWCKINNFNFMYWNYPQDSNDKIPNLTLNLINCINDKIETVSQEICPRPKSFNIKLKNETCVNNTVMTIYFSADNQNDLNYWLNGLNDILDFKKTWMKI